MKVVGAEIDWMKGWGSTPNLKVTVDKVAESHLIHYRMRHTIGGTAYWAEIPDSPFVAFFHHSPGNQAGYGGRIFAGFTVDGEPFSVKGPWSSNALEMNGMFPAVHSVSIYERDGKYPDMGYHGFAIRWKEAIDLLAKLDAGVAVVLGYGSGRDGENEVAVPKANELLGEAYLNPEAVIGRYDIVPTLKGRTLTQSQEEKNIGWSCGKCGK